MILEKAQNIQEKVEKLARVVLKCLVETKENKSGKIFISGKTGKEIKYDTNFTPEEINAAVEYMEVNNWVKSIPDINQDHEYKFLQVEIKDKGREINKEWHAERK